MSCVTRRKHVLKEMMEDDYELPRDGQQIVKVVRCRGNNLHEVETANVGDDHFLVTMPTKFRKNVYVKRGDYILVEPIAEGDKVKAEICKILTPEHVKEYTKANIWPKNFATKNNRIIEDYAHNKCVGSDSDDDDLEPNMNRPTAITSIDDSSDEDDADTDESFSSEED